MVTSAQGRDGPVGIAKHPAFVLAIVVFLSVVYSLPVFLAGYAYVDSDRFNRLEDSVTWLARVAESSEHVLGIVHRVLLPLIMVLGTFAFVVPRLKTAVYGFVFGLVVLLLLSASAWFLVNTFAVEFDALFSVNKGKADAVKAMFSRMGDVFLMYIAAVLSVKIATR